MSLKTELVQYLEGQILSLSHAIRRKEQKQHPQISSVEAFNLVDTSFGSKAKSTTSNGIQTDLPMLRRNDEAVQVNTATLERVGSSKNLNEMERLSRKLLEMSQQLQEKDRLISSLSGGASDAEHTKQIERICNEMVQENTRLKTLILEGAVPDSKSTDDTRIRIITKDISKCDLSAITNPLLVREISELRLFRAAASKEL
ncbi:MAG: hypothetical protein JST59_00325 [Actinobacteria bacterium]|nr:hypothetical protein [Actinomycetota bacterium]